MRIGPQVETHPVRPPFRVLLTILLHYMYMVASNPTVQVRLRSPWLPALLAALVFLQATNPSRVWQYLLTGMLLANVAAFYWMRELRDKVSVERRLLWSWAQVGDLLEEEFTLRNDSWLPVLWAEVVDHSTVPEYAAGRVETASGRSQRSWKTQAVCRLRGQFQLGPWELRLGDPFAVFELRFPYPDVTDVTVFPPVVKVPQLSLPRGAASGTSRSRARAQESTIDVAGIRQYLPGDSLRHVHWPTVARQQSLFVREFDREPSGSLWILLDLDGRVQTGEGAESTTEYGVILAASLANLLLRENRPVGLFSQGSARVLIRPNVGLNHLWSLMRSLTLVQAGPGAPLAELIEEWSRMSSRDATLAVITPSTESTWLPPLMRVLGRGIAANVTFLDASSFDGRERGLGGLIGSLAELGVQSRVMRAGMEFEHLVPLAYRGIPRFRVTPTGRATLIPQPEAAS